MPVRKLEANATNPLKTSKARLRKEPGFFSFITTMFQQHYDRYTAQDQLVWKVLFDRQTAVLHKRAASAFANGLKQLGFHRNAIPAFDEVNERLRSLTGWELVPVAQNVSDTTFFSLLAQRKFPAMTKIRSMEHFDFVQEPDLFHDVFGHAPLLTDPVFADFLHFMGRVASQHLYDGQALERFRALYGFTVQFGLVLEEGKPRIYGAGLLSSASETHHCVHEETPRQPFDLATVLNATYTEQRLQEQYFVLHAWDQLTVNVAEMAALLASDWELKTAC